MDTHTWTRKGHEILTAIKANNGLNSMFVSQINQYGLYPVRLIFTNGRERAETIPSGLVIHFSARPRPEGLNAEYDDILSLLNNFPSFGDVRIQARFNS